MYPIRVGEQRWNNRKTSTTHGQCMQRIGTSKGSLRQVNISWHMYARQHGNNNMSKTERIHVKRERERELISRPLGGHTQQGPTRTSIIRGVCEIN